MPAFFQRLRSPLLHLALGYGAAFIVAFLLLGLAGYLTLSAITEEAMTREVRHDLVDLRQWQSDAGLAGLREALGDRDVPDNRDAFYRLEARGKTLAVPASLQLPPTLIKQVGWHDIEIETATGTRPALVRVELFRDGSRLIVGHVAWERERLDAAVMRGLGWGLSLLVSVALGLALVMSWAVAKALAGPLAAAERMANGELGTRVQSNGSGDSFDRLAQALNGMFARIQELVGGIAHSTDAIAHDLRTPLTRLKTRLEQVRANTPEGDAAQALDAAMAETDSLLNTFQALLRLTRLEADTRTLPVQRVDLAELVGDAAELFEALAESRQQTLRVTSVPALIQGDRDQLFQLLVNLIDNAIKYSPEGSEIHVRLQLQGGHVLLSVSDTGPGIPVANRERVFDRFVRLEAHRGSPGNGLGLSLVRAIALRHHASLRLDDARPGLKVTVDFPAARITASITDN
ncbi:MAG: HAMP domain-containing sensor histidine kinase [bacterium]|nr:HAMP domain-containing sensor histidine kinase [bacterium]